jgi:site-specific DNA-cytosine methylase
MFRLIKEIKPEFVIGENVQGLVNLQNGMVLRQVQDDLEGEGFEVQCFLIPASGIGAWHQRFRVWIVGHSKHNGLLAAEKRSRDKKINGGTQEGQNQTIEFERTSGSRNDEDVSNTERKRLEGLSEQGTTLSRENERSQFGSTNSSRSSEDVSNSTILGTGGCRDSDQEEGREGCSSTQSDGKRSNVSYTISELSVGCSSTTRDSEAELIRLECNEGWHWNQVRSQVERCSEQDLQQIPTPTAHDSKNVTFPISQKGKSTVVGNMLKNEIPKPGGKLNPTFVEFLMGFPENWTKIEQAESKVSETQSSHKWQESSDSQSKKFYRTPTAMDKGDNSFKYAAKILKGKLNRSQSKQPVQKTLSMDVAMEHLKNNQHLIDAYDEKFKMRPHLPPKDNF